MLLAPDAENVAAELHTVIHELGHLLNLPHPWEKHGPSRSAMTYPWRWANWNWKDPSVYHFDDFGKHHVLHAPEAFVRPGGSEFLEYAQARE